LPECGQKVDIPAINGNDPGRDCGLGARRTDRGEHRAEPVESYVRRRHAHLKTYGTRNPEIFARIADELTARVVAAAPLTERQLRRIVYG
jgi:hypothetical protein